MERFLGFSSIGVMLDDVSVQNIAEFSFAFKLILNEITATNIF